MDDLIDLVIAQIEHDFKIGDLTALEELLKCIPKHKLEGYLPK
jgi:hypothetical protein